MGLTPDKAANLRAMNDGQTPEPSHTLPYLSVFTFLRYVNVGHFSGSFVGLSVLSQLSNFRGSQRWRHHLEWRVGKMTSIRFHHSSREEMLALGAWKSEGSDCTWMQQHILWFYTGTLSGRNFAPFIKARQVKSRQGLLGSNARRQGHDIEFT